MLVPYNASTAHSPVATAAPAATTTASTLSTASASQPASAAATAAPTSNTPHLAHAPHSNWQPADIPITAAAILGAQGGAKAAEAGYKTAPDEADNGDADKGYYRNEFLKFSYTYPAKWSPDSAEELDRQNGNTTRWLQAQPLAGFTVVPVPKILMTARPDARARLPFARVSVQTADSTDATSAQADADRLAQVTGATIHTPPQTIALGKHTVYLMDFQLPAADPPLYIAAVEFQSGPCRVTIELAAASRDELAALVKTLPSLKFYDK
jgi:hypothetical protein